MGDCTSKALAEASLPGEPRTYDTISKRSRVPLTTLYHRHYRRRSKEQKAQSQQHLTPPEEKALEKYLELEDLSGDDAIFVGRPGTVKGFAKAIKEEMEQQISDTPRFVQDHLSAEQVRLGW